MHQSSSGVNNNSIDNTDFNLIEIMNKPSRLRTERGISKLIQLIRNLYPFATLLHLNNPQAESELITDLALVISHKKYKPNTIVKRIGDTDSKVLLILKGKVAELGIKYERIKLTQEEYLIHLLKLEMINERELLHECLKQNRTKYPISNWNSSTMSDGGIKSWIKQYHTEEADTYINQAIEDIKEVKDKYQNQSMEYYLNITNPFDIEEHNNIKIDSKMKYSLLIPSFCHLKTLKTGDYIGSLYTLNMKYKTYSLYVTLEKTSMGIIDKNVSIKVTNSNLSHNNDYCAPYFHLNNLISHSLNDDLRELMHYFFIFQPLNPECFEHIISSLISYRVLTKGDMLMRQNSFYEGIYFVKSGQFKVSTQRTVDDLMSLIITLKQSLDNIPGVNTYLKNNIIEEYNSNFDYSNRTSQFANSNSSCNCNSNGIDNNYYNLRKKKMHNVTFLTTNSRHIIGLNEYFNSKTDIVTFNVECISNKAEVVFLPKESYFGIIDKNEDVKSRITNLIEQNVGHFIQTIRKFREKIREDTELIKVKKQHETLYKSNHYNKSFLLPIQQSFRSTNSSGYFSIEKKTKRQTFQLPLVRNISLRNFALNNSASQRLLLLSNKNAVKIIDKNKSNSNNNQCNKTFNEKKFFTPLANKIYVNIDYTRNSNKKVQYSSFRIKDRTSIIN